jgi:uncharacterized protein (TIGR03067 family)
VWQAVRREVAGGDFPAEAARRLREVFAGDPVTLLEDGKPSGIGTCTVQAKASLKTLDLALRAGPAIGQSAFGIHQLAGDRPTSCIGPACPTGFNPTRAATLVELERVVDG